MTERRVVFSPSGKQGLAQDGETLLDVARKFGVDLDSVCGGRGICGRCQVSVGEGEFAKHQIFSSPDHITPRNAVEDRYAARKPLAEGRRLGCQARLCGDVVVDVPPDSQFHRQVIRKDLGARSFAIDPTVRAYYVVVAEPDMDLPASDLTRLLEALARDWGLTGIEVPLAVLPGLQKTLRAGGWTATAALRDGKELTAVYPGLQERLYGMAVDIGSTTIAAHLCDLATGVAVASSGVMNPQIRFGEDLMSRVSYAMMNADGAAAMTRAVRAAVNDLAGDLATAAAIDRSAIVEAVCVGNPVMHHLFLGIDPVELGGAPFALAIDQAFSAPAIELGLSLAPGARVQMLPCIAGHVGADAAAVLLAEAPQDQDALTLVVDVGTNAEIFLGDRSRILACSSPTGPAFEGAQISAGQRAAPGAIERFRIDRATLEPRYKVIGQGRWSDEPEFDADVTGICGSGIIEAVAELFLAGVIRSDGTIDGAMAERSPRVQADGRTFRYVIREREPAIAVTQADVRAIQLAKAALYAGVKLLMDRFGAAKVDRIALAGAFGSYIDPIYAMTLGLLPDCDPAHVSSAGNAAGTGAMIALLDCGARAELSKLVGRVEKIETAMAPDFQRLFVDAMALPHLTDPYPELSRHVILPTPSAPQPRQRGGSQRAGSQRAGSQRAGRRR